MSLDEKLDQDMVKNEIKKIFSPGKTIVTHDFTCKVFKLISEKGSESDVYLAKLNADFFHFNSAKIIPKDTALALKIYYRKNKDISTCQKTFKQSIEHFKASIVENINQYCDTDELGKARTFFDLDHYPSYYFFNNMNFMQILNRKYPKYFPIFFGKGENYTNYDLVYNNGKETAWKNFVKQVENDIYEEIYNEIGFVEWDNFDIMKEDRWKSIYRYVPFYCGISEYVGDNLESILKSSTAINDSTKIRIINRLFQSVCALQSCGIIHKDINFTNILLGKYNLAKITDFSIAQELRYKYFYFHEDAIKQYIDSDEDYPFETIQMFLGNRLFMPPEVHMGFLAPKNDIWAIGLVAYSVFTREHLIPLVFNNYDILNIFETSKEQKREYSETLYKLANENYSKLKKIIKERIMEAPQIPDDYKKAILFCTKVNPATRRDMNYILNTLKIAIPQKQLEHTIVDHEHNKNIVYPNGQKNCSYCTLIYMNSWDKQDRKAFGEIPIELKWKGRNIDEVVKL